MQIEDINESLDLNFTSKFPLRNYRRFPTNQFDPISGKVKDYAIYEQMGEITHPDSNLTHIKYKYPRGDKNFFDACLITNITVTRKS